MVRLKLVDIHENLKKQNDNTVTFMGMYGPKNVTRIALDRNVDGKLELIFDNQNGPKFDGTTEILNAALLANGDTDKSLLVKMQVATPKVGNLSKDEQRMIGDTFAMYLKDDKDVTLSAKGDETITFTQVTNYAAEMGNNFVATANKDIEDFAGPNKDGDILIFVDGKIASMPVTQLAMNLEKNGTKITLGATKIIPVGQDTKLARGPKFSGNDKLFAYYKAEPTGKKMIVLDPRTLAELNTVDVRNADYVTANHKRDEVIFVSRLPGNGKNVDDTFTVNRTTAEKFFENQASAK